MNSVRIKAGTRLHALNPRELVRYRDLLFYLTWKELKVRYKQTALGASWAVLQPLLLMAIFSIFLGRLAKVPSEGAPYPLFVFCALVPWTFISQAMSGAANTLVLNAEVIRKVYFPRVLLPLSVSLSFSVDLFFSILVLTLMAIWYGVSLSLNLLWTPVFLILSFVIATAVGTGLSAVNVKYRDVRYALPFLSQIWLFASPIAYPSTLIPTQWIDVYSLNPMVAIADGMRWSFLGVGPPPTRAVLWSALVALLLAIVAAAYFTRVERTFADIV